MRTSLIELARQGDEVAFADLVDLDSGGCYAIAYRILAEESRRYRRWSANVRGPAGRRPGRAQDRLDR